MQNRMFLITLIVALAGSASLAMQDSNSGALPQGHPPIQPQLPQGHPAIEPGQRPQPGGASEADSADVATIESIVNAYYNCISGPKDQPRDWGRFQSLFSPEARFITVREMNGQIIPFALTPKQFVQANATYFEGGGYFEQDVSRVTEHFGSVAHVFSTYETRRSPETEPYSRGINSIQLLNTGDRWWIVTIMWDYERAGNPIPQQYLPPSPENAMDAEEAGDGS
jgi:hypothetical protein